MNNNIIYEKDAQEKFITRLLDNCQDHEEWLLLVKFGLPTLIENQIFLFELVSKETMRLLEDSDFFNRDFCSILSELGLEIKI